MPGFVPVVAHDVLAQVQPRNTLRGVAGQCNGPRDAAHQPQREQGAQHQGQAAERQQRPARLLAPAAHGQGGRVDGLALRLRERIQRPQQCLRRGQEAFAIHLLNT